MRCVSFQILLLLKFHQLNFRNFFSEIWCQKILQQWQKFVLSLSIVKVNTLYITKIYVYCSSIVTFFELIHKRISCNHQKRSFSTTVYCSMRNPEQDSISYSLLIYDIWFQRYLVQCKYVLPTQIAEETRNIR